MAQNFNPSRRRQHAHHSRHPLPRRDVLRGPVRGDSASSAAVGASRARQAERVRKARPRPKAEVLLSSPQQGEEGTEARATGCPGGRRSDPQQQAGPRRAPALFEAPRRRVIFVNHGGGAFLSPISLRWIVKIKRKEIAYLESFLPKTDLLHGLS